MQVRPGCNGIEYPYTFKSFEGIPGILGDMVTGGMYVWDSRAMVGVRHGELGSGGVKQAKKTNRTKKTKKPTKDPVPSKNTESSDGSDSSDDDDED